MKKIFSLLTLSTTLTAGAIWISSCGFGSKKVLHSNQIDNSQITDEKEYIEYNIDLNYDEIFYTPTFAIENEEEEWEPYKNEKYDNKLFFYSPSTTITDSYKIFYDGDGEYFPSHDIEEINFFQSIVNSARLHETYLKNKELFNNFDFDDKTKNFYDSLIYPTTGKFTNLEGDWQKGDYHLNIHHNNLNCTINAKTKNTDFKSDLYPDIYMNKLGNFSSFDRTDIWTFSADPNECQWFSEDLKERFVFARSEEIEFMMIDKKIAPLWGNISSFKKILNNEPLKVKIKEDGTIYDEWFRGTNRERIIEKDFWTALDKPYDTDIFSPQEKVNPRNIVYSKDDSISFYHIIDMIHMLCDYNKEFCLLDNRTLSKETFRKLYNLALNYKNIYESIDSFKENTEDKNALTIDFDAMEDLILSPLHDFASNRLLNDFEESLNNGDDLKDFVTKILNSNNYNETYKILFKSLFYKDNDELTTFGINIQDQMSSDTLTILKKKQSFENHLMILKQWVETLIHSISDITNLSDTEEILKIVNRGYHNIRYYAETISLYLKSFIKQYFPGSNNNIGNIGKLASIISNIVHLDELNDGEELWVYQIYAIGKHSFDIMNNVNEIKGLQSPNNVKFNEAYNNLKDFLIDLNEKLVPKDLIKQKQENININHSKIQYHN